MARAPNPTISSFRHRVEWIVENLDSDPTYARFLSEPGDVYDALISAIEHGRYALYPAFSDTKMRQTGISRRSWEQALSTDHVSPHFIRWLCDLFPDLAQPHLRCPDFEEFLLIGQPIQAARQRWGIAAQLYSKERKRLHTEAMKFYANVQTKDLDAGLSPHQFPLLYKPGWIRARPLPLEADTEAPYLSMPGPMRSFEREVLEGLSADYIAYRGKLGLRQRRRVRPEPQHNGEIFTVRSVVESGGDFVGFKYDLGLYFDYINTSEILGIELADEILRDRVGKGSTFRGAPDDAFDFAKRAGYPGVNCLTVFLNYSEPGLKPGNRFLLHKRDETQMQAQNSVHVVPAGGHQGFAKGAQREDTALWRTLVREFAEELFDKERLATQMETWSEFEQHPDIVRIKSAFFDGANPAAKVFLHGFGLDPITLKPEVLCTIIIDWSKLGSKPMPLKYNWELQTSRSDVTRHQWVPLSREALVREATDRHQTIGDQKLDALPAGAACLLLTAKHYDFLGLPTA